MLKFKKLKWELRSVWYVATGVGDFTAYEEDGKWYIGGYTKAPAKISNILFMSTYDTLKEAQDHLETLIQNYVLETFFE